MLSVLKVFFWESWGLLAFGLYFRRHRSDGRVRIPSGEHRKRSQHCFTGVLGFVVAIITMAIWAKQRKTLKGPVRPSIGNKGRLESSFQIVFFLERELLTVM